MGDPAHSPPGDDRIRLRYARTRSDGFAFPGTFAWFGSEEEPMMAAELMERLPADLREASNQPYASGFEPYIEGLHRLGGKRAADILLADKPGMVGLIVSARAWSHQVTIYAPGDTLRGTGGAAADNAAGGHARARPRDRGADRGDPTAAPRHQGLQAGGDAGGVRGVERGAGRARPAVGPSARREGGRERGPRGHRVGLARGRVMRAADEPVRRLRRAAARLPGRTW